MPRHRRVLRFEPGLAMELAIAAGRLNSCFNLLEFRVSSLGPMEPHPV